MTAQELLLSHSSIVTYLRCHYAWLLAYVHRVRQVPRISTAIGIAVHAGAAAHWAGGDRAGTTQSRLETEMASMPALEPAEASGAVAGAQRAIAAYAAKIAPTFRPALVEQTFLIRINGTLVSGQIDAADEDVHDTKTAKTPSDVKPEEHRLQMSIYRHGYKALTGHFPKRLLLDIVGLNGRTKTVEVQPDDAGMAEVIGIVAKGVEAGDFEPTGARSGRCRSCFYVASCRFANLTASVESRTTGESSELEMRETA
jgi:hypothetical protein